MVDGFFQSCKCVYAVGMSVLYLGEETVRECMMLFVDCAHEAKDDSID